MSEEFDATIDSYVEPPVALETEAEYAARVGSEPAGLAHDGSARTMIGGPIEHRMPWILDHPGILGALRGVIGAASERTAFPRAPAGLAQPCGLASA